MTNALAALEKQLGHQRLESVAAQLANHDDHQVVQHILDILGDSRTDANTVPQT